MPGGYSGLFKNTKGAKEHDKNLFLMTETIKEFGTYLIDTCDTNGENHIHVDDIPDLVAEFIENL